MPTTIRRRGIESQLDPHRLAARPGQRVVDDNRHGRRGAACAGCIQPRRDLGCRYRRNRDTTPPVQVQVLTITSDADDYADEVAAALRAAGLRAETDKRNEKISYKVREHSVSKTPVLLAIGQREVQERTVAMRRLGSKKQTVLALDDAVTQLAEEALSHG